MGLYAQPREQGAQLSLSPPWLADDESWILRRRLEWALYVPPAPARKRSLDLEVVTAAEWEALPRPERPPTLDPGEAAVRNRSACKARRDTLIGQGLCPHCKGPVAPGKSYCAPRLEEIRIHIRWLRWNRRQRCAECGQRERAPRGSRKSRFCADCLERRRVGNPLSQWPLPAPTDIAQ